MSLKRSLQKRWKALRTRWRATGKSKYFCIGKNKTGTTSLAKVFKDLGYPVGNQTQAELLAVDHYLAGRFQPIIDYCKSAQVFQDAPFSYPETYKHLDQAYPGSKFILTVRDDAEQWYSSLTRFHSKKFGKNGQLPTASDLKAATYVRPGRMYQFLQINGTPEDDPYNKSILIANYHKYNAEVIEYFKDRPGDLLVINVSQSADFQRLMHFLGERSDATDFPWQNRT